MRNKKPVVALMYDFDKTLCTKDMQEYTFISDVGMTTDEFWTAANDISEKNNMDRVLAYMYIMLDKARSAKKSIHREDFVHLGKDLEFYNGVEDWFSRINKIGDDLGLKVEHYIISSGLREIIEGSSIFQNFKEVFACEFLYDENGIACWPKNAVNYTTKTQFIFRINKNILDISNDDDLNKYTPDDFRPVPFRNMIYIGDGLTDVPCMKLVKLSGGHSIAVYPKTKRKKVEELLIHNRVNFVELADYTKGSSLENAVTDILKKISVVESLVKRHKQQTESFKQK